MAHVDVLTETRNVLVLRVHGQQREGTEGRGLIVYVPAGASQAAVAANLRTAADSLEKP